MFQTTNQYIYNFKYPYLTCTMLYLPPAWQVRAAPAPVKAVAWAGSPPRRGEGGGGKYNRGKTWENTWKSCEKLKKLWESWEKLGKSWESRWKFHRKREHIGRKLEKLGSMLGKHEAKLNRN